MTYKRLGLNSKRRRLETIERRKNVVPIFFLIQKILAPTNKIEARIIELEHEINKNESKLTSYISLSNKLDNQKGEISSEVFTVSTDIFFILSYLRSNFLYFI